MIDNTNTKVSESGFESSDEIGVYVVDYSGTTPGILSLNSNHGTNVKHTYNASLDKWTPETGKEVYWNNATTKVDVYGYFPYNTTISSISDYVFSVKSDQSTLANYFSSDFLWAKTSNVNSQTFPVRLTFGHKMSKIVITATAGVGFTENEFNAAAKSIQILGTKLSSKINLTNGVVSIDNSVESGIISTRANANVFSAILVPQTILESSAFIKLTVNGVEYYYSKGLTFEPGKQYNFSVSVNKNSLSIVSNNVSDWIADLNNHLAQEKSTIKDVEGNIYTTVKIGTQTWLGENLKTTKLNDGKEISNITTDWQDIQSPAYCWYNNSKNSYKNPYGALYNWYVVNTGKICPDGWRVPSNEDWNTLVGYIGSVDAALKLRVIGDSFWPIAIDDSNNEFGFSAYGAGHKVYNRFESLNQETSWWSTTVADRNSSNSWGILSTANVMNKQGDPLHFGISIRCMKGDIILMDPIIKVISTDEITSTSAKVYANIPTDGGSLIISKGVCWGTSTNPTISQNKNIQGDGTGSFYSTLTNLSPGTQYYARVFATTSKGTAYSENVSIRTL